jgi:DDE superfamily endonuclease
MELVREVDMWLSEFRAVFRRQVAFGWFVLSLWAFLLHFDGSGLSSLIRYFGLASSEYYNLLHFFHSSAFSVQGLCARWVELLGRKAPVLQLEGQPVYVVDGLVAGKAGKKMPGVKMLHQASENNNKPEFVMGHFWGALSMLAQAGSRLFAVPLRFSIQDGVKSSPSQKGTLITRMHQLVAATAQRVGTVLADCQYACRPFIEGLLSTGFHLIARVRLNTVAFEPAPKARKRKRGRPKKYGKKVVLQQLFARKELFRSVEVELYGRKQQALLYEVVLYWQTRLVKFVLSVDDKGRKAIFLSTRTALSAEAIVVAYGWRFKIEVGFKALVERMFAFCYRFWMKAMEKRKRGDGDQYLHRAGEHYRAQVARKLEAYERFVNMAAIGLGLLQMLSLRYAEQVWDRLPLWFRTLRKEVGPSEHIVRATLQAEVDRIFASNDPGSLLAKILATRSKAPLSPHPLKWAA